METAGEPENVDLLAETEIRKNGMPCEKPPTRHTLPAHSAAYEFVMIGRESNDQGERAKKLHKNKTV